MKKSDQYLQSRSKIQKHNEEGEREKENMRTRELGRLNCMVEVES